MAHCTRLVLPLSLLLTLGCSVEDEYSNPIPAGAKCYQPPYQAGGACTADYQCAHGTSCFPAACRALAADGAGCKTGADCAAGLYCSCSTVACKQGVTGTCHQPGSLADGAGCASDKSCSSSICSSEAGYKCQQPAAAGGACSAHDECASGLICHLKDKKCQPPLASGTECTERWECASGLVCAVKKDKSVCATAAGGFGYTCMDTPQKIREWCGGKTVCNTGKGTCAYPAKEGEICGGKGSCETGLVCNTGALPGKCIKPGTSAAGEPCSGKTGDDEVDCSTGLICVSMKCVQPGGQGAGEVCKRSIECAPPYKCPVSE